MVQFYYRNRKQITTLLSLSVLSIISSTYVLELWIYITKKILCIFGFPMMMFFCSTLGVYFLFKPWGLLDNCLFYYRFQRRHASEIESYKVFKLIKKLILRELDKLIEFTQGRNIENLLNLNALPEDFKLKFDIKEGVTLYELLTALRARLVDGYEKIPLWKLREVHLQLKFKKAERNAENKRISKVIPKMLRGVTPDSVPSSVPDFTNELLINEGNIPQREEISVNKPLTSLVEFINLKQNGRNISDDEFRILQKQRSYIALLRLLTSESRLTKDKRFREEGLTNSIAPSTELVADGGSSSPDDVIKTRTFMALLELMARLADLRKTGKELRMIRRKRRKIIDLVKTRDDKVTCLIQRLNKVQSAYSLNSPVNNFAQIEGSEHGCSGDGLRNNETQYLDDECKLQKRRSINSLRELLGSPFNEETELVINERKRLIAELAKSENQEERLLAEQLTKSEITRENQMVRDWIEPEGLVESLSYSDLRKVEKKRVVKSLINLLCIPNEKMTNVQRLEKLRLTDELAKSDISEERHLAEELRKLELLYQECLVKKSTKIDCVQEGMSFSSDFKSFGDNKSSKLEKDGENEFTVEESGSPTAPSVLFRRKVSCFTKL